MDEATSEATSLTIRAEASDNASAFIATPLNISTRSKTALSVSWSPAAWDTVDEAGPDQRTPSLAFLVQEIVNRPGWVEGNAIAFIIAGSGKRVADSFEEDMHGAAYLHIEYMESNDPPAPSGGTILTFQPDGVYGLDTYLLSSSSSSNYGTSSDMGVGENNNSTNKYARSLIKFDLSSMPANATIVSATLSLWTSKDYSDNDSIVRVYRLKVPFHETQATWNISSTGVNWQTPGASGANDRESLDIGSVQILSNEPLNTEKQFQLSPEKIQELVNGGVANNGFILVADAELNNRFDFKTSDTSTAGMRPKLVIEYTIASPQPSGELGLQITPNPATFAGAGASISYTYTLTNIGTVPLNGPYTVSDDTIASVDCSAALSPLPVGQATTCVGSYTTTSADVTAGYVTNSATATASDGTQTITSEVATATINYQIPPPPSGPVTVEYFYDPLNRLTEANYSNGDYYHYTYDAVGNRLTQDKMVLGLLSTDTYLYDDANRIETVNAATYTFDANGNLLNDGQNSYTYDSANQLISLNGTESYTYNGLGDRLSQDGVHYTLDLNAGLTQVLADGANTYTYGLGRISQTGNSTEYFLGDALGSVRQLTDTNAEITLAKSYAPYGEVTSSDGSGISPFAFTGEQQDASGLTYLRARYYNPVDGRFTSRDTFAGYLNLSQSQNRFAYAHNNPILYTDPSGHSIPVPFFMTLARSWGQSVIRNVFTCDNYYYISGALYQYLDDVSIGLYSNYALNLDNLNIAAFQEGQNLGHGIAMTQAMIETTIGSLAVVAAIPTITITLGGSAVCVTATGGLCAIPAAPVIAGELSLLAWGTALTTHGGLMVVHAADSGGGGGSGWRPLGVNDLPSSYKPPRGGPRKVIVMRGPYTGRVGWLDANGDIWVASKAGESHGGPHWDVQINGGKGGHRNVFP